MDLSALVAEVVRRHADTAAGAACELRPQIEAGVFGTWDDARLDQVVSNLLENAFKYGAGRPVDVALRREGGEAILTVRDQGIGIAAAEQARIFGRFERAVSHRHFGGFGLGLWIVRQIVDASGGRIEVASAPGEGATFRVALPGAHAGASTSAPSEARA